MSIKTLARRRAYIVDNGILIAKLAVFIPCMACVAGAVAVAYIICAYEGDIG